MDLEIGAEVAVVTGARRGIGLATAALLAREGARVVMVSRDVRGLEQAADQLRAAGGQVWARPTDLSQAADVAGLAKETRERWGEPSILVLSAAAAGSYQNLLSQEVGALAESVATALRLVELPLRAFLGGLQASGRGRLIVLGSLAGEIGGAGQAAYASGKAALLGLVRSVALEHGRDGLSANLVVPGAIDTERLREALSEDQIRRLAHGTPQRRLGTAAEVAALIGFLASRSAGFITGAAVPITGGHGLGPNLVTDRP